MQQLEPALGIILRLGGFAKVREITRTSATSPYRWTYPRSRGGTGGTIPQRHHPTLISYARLRRIPLDAEEFLPSPRRRRRRA
jgi:hypothetical protein